MVLVQAVDIQLAHLTSNICLRSSARDDAMMPVTRLSLSIFAGDRIALSGPSGSGKSILLRTLALLERVKRGAVQYRGNTVLAHDVPAFRRAVSYVPQRPILSGVTVRDALQQPFRLAVRKNQHYTEKIACEWLQLAGKSPDFLEKATATLSGGEMQVAALVRSLQLEPEALLLDEPTAALDPSNATAIETLVDAWISGSAAAHERAYVWISHDPDQADRIGVTHWRMSAHA